MDEYLTDDQEVDRAKQWLRENGAFLVAGVVLGLGGLFGWQQWQTASLEHAGEASLVWEQMQTAVAGDRFNEAEETLDILATDYSDTPYYDQARLAMAKLHMDRSEPEAAASQLRELQDSAGDPLIARIAELRLAQVLLYQQQPEEALAIIGLGRVRRERLPASIMSYAAMPSWRWGNSRRLATLILPRWRLPPMV